MSCCKATLLSLQCSMDEEVAAAVLPATGSQLTALTTTGFASEPVLLNAIAKLTGLRQLNLEHVIYSGISANFTGLKVPGWTLRQSSSLMLCHNPARANPSVDCASALTKLILQLIRLGAGSRRSDPGLHKH